MRLFNANKDGTVSAQVQASHSSNRSRRDSQQRQRPTRRKRKAPKREAVKHGQKKENTKGTNLNSNKNSKLEIKPDPETIAKTGIVESKTGRPTAAAWPIKKSDFGHILRASMKNENK